MFRFCRRELEVEASPHTLQADPLNDLAQTRRRPEQQQNRDKVLRLTKIINMVKTLVPIIKSLHFSVNNEHWLRKQ